METSTATATRSPFATLLAALLALGIARGALKAFGLLALAVVVLVTVAALAVGILVLRVALA